MIPAVCFADDTKDNVTNMKLLIYKDQQENINNMIYDNFKKSWNSINTGLKASKQNMSGFGRRNNKDYKKEAEEYDRNIDKLKLDKNELKIKVIELNGKLPDWWEENEAYLIRRQRHYME